MNNPNISFSIWDRAILTAMIRRLPKKQRRAVYLRFWFDMTIQQIARKMRLSWSESHQLIEEGVSRLKDLCLRHPTFSKSNE
ncbi:MAG: sigma-70 region 4 domain-containing protein [Bacteriovoracales bacterium]|nr:sigma-70 region 4 domain-containing protein [Bacteriovoracales bacterium]